MERDGDDRGLPREVQDKPLVVEGEDDVPRQPADVVYSDPELSPRAPRGRALQVLWWAWPIVIVAVGVVVWAAVR